MIINPDTGAVAETAEDLLQVITKIQELEQRVRNAKIYVENASEAVKAAKEELKDAENALRVYVTDSKGEGAARLVFQGAR